MLAFRSRNAGTFNLSSDGATPELIEVEGGGFGECLGFGFRQVSDDLLIASDGVLFWVAGNECDEFCRIEFGVFARIDDDRSVIGIHRFDAELSEHNFELEDIFEIEGFLRRRAVSIDDFAEDVVDLLGRFGIGEPFVEEQSHLYVVDIGFG